MEVVAYVPQQALSAAALICLSCDRIAMAPGARIGDAGPIFLDDNFMFRHAPEKIRSDLVSRIRRLAEETGRPPALAEAMVDMNAIVYRYEHTQNGSVRLATEQEIASDQEPLVWKKMQMILESQAGRFLELTGSRAKELGLIEMEANNQNELLKELDIDPQNLMMVDWTLRDTTVSVLNHSVATVILLACGIAGLYVEMLSPGLGFGSMLSITSFSLFFWSRMLGGTAEWLEIVLFVLGVLLLAVELFVLPGFGVWGLTGLVCMASSLVLASQSFIVPERPDQWLSFGKSLFIVTGVLVGSGLIGVLMLSHMQSIPWLQRLLLTPATAEQPSTKVAGPTNQPTDDAEASRVAPQLGDIAIVESTLRPGGQIRFGSHVYNAHTSGDFVPRGTRVMVDEIGPLGLRVREIS
ncbi:MAG: hypothetical protein O2931_14220 [Planctomycetota bacterium]|nr:hypothetical protein [Planctomycetota bacterium]MDA1179941.1 hypothetical protein [Planctomycetota bacterium]